MHLLRQVPEVHLRRDLVGQLREFLPKVYEEYGPLNARQYAYRAEDASNRESWTLKVTKPRFDYLNSILTNLREEGILPWDAVLDSSREFDPWLVEASEDMDKEVNYYVRQLKELPKKFDLPKWQYQPVIPVIFTEKEGLVPYFDMVTERRAVSIYAQKGQVGKSHLHEHVFPWLIKLAASGRKVRILYLGDVDDEGYQIPLTLIETISKWYHNSCPKFDIKDLYPRHPSEIHHDGSMLEFERVALKPEQVERYGLSILDPNPKSKIYRKFVDYKCELEALNPNILRKMIEEKIGGCWDDGAEKRRKRKVKELRGKLADKVRRLAPIKLE